jgi:D-alanyl-lipoteichoic acid acyltransferase DltB (MBOAT superfamily)
MLFNSFTFLIFFPLVTAGYFLLPHRWRWAWLLAASCCFYMYFIPIYILVLGVTIVVDYCAGPLIAGAEGGRRKWFLGLSIAANVGVLAVFKYFNFANGNLDALAKAIGWNYPVGYLTLALPIGLSFHTFQAMSYTIEVYRGRQKPELHFGIYALYVMFYPQLVAGPIERPQNLIHQFRERHYFDYDRVVSGLRLMAWGLFKKAFVADRLAPLVNQVYGHPSQSGGPALTMATIAFAFQIYYDFSGYSDVAIGAARIMGFRLMNNFDQPYHSQSIAEFWRRWHISLSTWFRDYLYIPLGGNRVARPRWCLNVFLVFLISGLWHGANWTYVIWGAIHGAGLIVGAASENLRARFAAVTGLTHWPGLHARLRVLMTFTLVSIAWIFFRAGSLPDAWQIFSRLGTRWPELLRVNGLQEVLDGLGVSGSKLILGVTGILIVESFGLLQLRRPVLLRVAVWPWWVRWSLYYAVVCAVVFFSLQRNTQFIYFQF